MQSDLSSISLAAKLEPFDNSDSMRRNTSVPVTVESCGLSQALLEDIVARQQFDTGVCDIAHLAARTALSSRLLESVIESLRNDGRVEVLGPASGSSALRYNLTDRGRQFAREARERSSYLGPAPISEVQYQKLIEQQSVHNLSITQQEMQKAYSDVVIATSLRDRLGAAMHSGKAIFIYGPAGTGKTFICSRLIQLLKSPVYIPHALVVGDSIVRIFDEAVHTPVASNLNDSAYFADRADPRLVLCDRPFVVSGGELSMDMLEIRQDSSSRQYLAPLQMKATHGIYMIDDLGRQKMSTDELFNRWIVPMESGVDYLNLDSGARLVLPFDVILIFSTNLLPEDLDDPAFQRRIGHKIGFEYSDEESYSQIWRQECARLKIECDEKLIQFAIHGLHNEFGTRMLACHPRDLIGMTLDYSRYAGVSTGLNKEGLILAWDNYFARST